MLGAFGVTVIDMVDILRPLQFILLGVSLISLYKAGRSCCYGPMWVTAAGALLIVGAMSVREGAWWVLKGYGVQGGNVLVVGGALWNLRKQGVMGI